MSVRAVKSGKTAGVEMRGRVSVAAPSHPLGRTPQHTRSGAPSPNPPDVPAWMPSWLSSRTPAWLARLLPAGLAGQASDQAAGAPGTPLQPAHYWHVKVREAVYGPYALADFAGFIAEGRIAGRTLVSEYLDTGFRPAGTIPELAHLFPVVQSEAEAKQQPLMSGQPRPAAAGIANFMIWADIVSGMASSFERELEHLGKSTRVGQSLWILRSRRSLADIRATLAPGLQRSDRAVIADCSNDRIAWVNVGIETDVRIKDVWTASDIEAV